jgi:chemotaxis methyl-accepting protein methylase
MKTSTGYDLSHIRFEGKPPARRFRSYARRECVAAFTAATLTAEERADDSVFISWVFERAGLDAAAYRSQPLHRRLPSCLRAMKVRSTHAARELLERKPQFVANAVSSLLIGVTEFFREPEVFDSLRAQILPGLAGGNRRLRIWSAACSSGAELYSMAILLSEAGLLERSYLLGSDCREDAIERARLGLYDGAAMKLVERARRDKYFEPAEGRWRPIEALRRQVQWKTADLLAGVERGPWDIILWRNAAMYLKSRPAEMIWRRLASILAPQGVLIAGKAERPPADAGLRCAARCIYRVADGPAPMSAGSPQPSLRRRSIREETALEQLL